MSYLLDYFANDGINFSEMHQIEQAMLKDKMSMTDWERTEEDLKDEVSLSTHISINTTYHSFCCDKIQMIEMMH